MPRSALDRFLDASDRRVELVGRLAWALVAVGVVVGIVLYRLLQATGAV